MTYTVDVPEKKKKAKRGVCRICGCTKFNACYPPCWWVDASETLCSNPDCIRKAKQQ